MEHFSTEYMAMFAPVKEYKPINGFDPVNMLVKRKMRIEQDAVPVDSLMYVSQYDPNDMAELELFCRQHGIIGVNFENQNPKTVLNRLKSQFGGGIKENQMKRGLLNG